MPEPDCTHPNADKPIWKFNQGNGALLCPDCRVILGYDPLYPQKEA